MPTTIHRRIPVLPVLGASACVLALAGCSLFGTKDAAEQTPQAPASSSPASSSPATIEDPKEVAVKVMDLFARPDMPERRWFTDLLPYLTDDYADEAQYVDPARVTVNKVKPRPKASQDEHNPQVVTVAFKTNDGPWQVVMVQDQDGEPWLVEAIEPNEPTPEFTP